jgi:hypothetical protein
MASSYPNQIPVIIHVIQQLKPKTILDIGKGFGKYGFLIHEFAGVDNRQRPDPQRTLAQQSGIAIDAVDINPDYSWPHISHLYREVKIGDVGSLYQSLPHYDLILMTDVIEHLDKTVALEMVKFFVGRGSTMLISTPVDYFQQDLYESEAEHHISHWTKKDFEMPGMFVDRQNVYPGRIFLVSAKPLNIRGFGHGLLKSIRRMGRTAGVEFDNIFGTK